MLYHNPFTLLFLVSSSIVAAQFSITNPYPQTYGAFSSTFKEPAPPSVISECRGHWIQHKWNEDLSHITAGFWYNSAAHGKVRVDETYDGSIGSSLFDFGNSTQDGGISNHLLTFAPNIGSKSQCFNDYVVNPGFPLITPTLLNDYNATFGGVVNDQWAGIAQTWNLLFAGTIPTIVYLNEKGAVLGYDIWSDVQRTKVITRFFNIIEGRMDDAIFGNFPC